MFAMGRLGKLGAVARAVQGAFAPFDPASLFANGEQGLWYDMSDFDRYMSELGPNSVVNGGFDDGLTGWINTGATISVTDGALLVSGSLSYSRASPIVSLPLEVGKYYVVSGDVKNGTAPDGGRIEVWGAQVGAINTPTVSDTESFRRVSAPFRADNASCMIRLVVSAGGLGGSSYFDNISVRELTAINTATLYQDAAGTIPVTAVEQPVGLILDKSGRGNHASQATTTARGVLRARYNLLTYSEDFSNPAWSKGAGINVTGTKKLVPTTASSIHKTQNLQASGLTSVTGQFTIRLRAKADGYNIIALWFDNASVGARFNVSNGTVVSSAGVVAGTTPTIVPDGDGYYKCEVTVSVTNGTQVIYIVDNANNVSFAGDGISGILVDWIDVRPTNLPSGLPPYQRIAAATDYDTAGFPVYLDIDGTDDSYQTGSIDFTATDKVTIWAGLRKVDDTARVFCELSANTGWSAGSFFFTTGLDQSSLYSTLARGAASANGNQTAKFTTGLYPAPDHAVITAQHDIAGDLSRIRRNGSSAGAIDGTDDKGTGNFGNYPLYLFSRGGTTLRWKGHFYSLVIRGAATNTETIGKMAQVINEQMKGVY